MIRPARTDDVEALLAIQRAACVKAFAHIYPPDLYPFPDDDIRDMWRDALDDAKIEAFVMEEDGRAVGCVAVGGEFLRNLYVIPERWQGGVGTALHDLA